MPRFEPIAFVILFVAAIASGDDRASGAASNADIERALDYVQAFFGQDLIEEQFTVTNTGLVNTDGEAGGVLVTFRFRIGSTNGAELRVLVEVPLTDEIFIMSGCIVPDCVEGPGLSGLNVGKDEAIAIAKGSGFSSTTGELVARLSAYDGVKGFFWEVRDKAAADALGWEAEAALVCARSGQVEKEREGAVRWSW